MAISLCRSPFVREFRGKPPITSGVAPIRGRARPSVPGGDPRTRGLERADVAVAGRAGACRPSALSPQPSALSPQPSALSPQPSALSPQPSALSPQLPAGLLATSGPHGAGQIRAPEGQADGSGQGASRPSGGQPRCARKPPPRWAVPARAAGRCAGHRPARPAPSVRQGCRDGHRRPGRRAGRPFATPAELRAPQAPSARQAFPRPDRCALAVTAGRRRPRRCARSRPPPAPAASRD